MSRQLDLFSSVLHAYAQRPDRTLANSDLYGIVADSSGLPEDAFVEKSPVGASGQVHSLLARKVRWHQQTLKHAGIIDHVPGTRGIWQLSDPASKDLNQIKNNVAVVGFSTSLGIAILGSCDHVFSAIDTPIHLCISSPPYPLAKQRNYGNPSEADYVDWICKTIEPVVRNLAYGGSICLNVGNDVFISGTPARSMYRERLVIALHERLGLHKMDEIIWHNPSKAPGPVQWASKQRMHLNSGYEVVYWMSPHPNAVRADNRRVLQEHTERHMRLMMNGGEHRDASFADGAYSVRSGSYGTVTPGKIPRNVLTMGHTCKSQRDYKKMAANAGLPVHGAPMPLNLASFLVEYMSVPGDLVADPFGGSMTTGLAAERLGRRWITTEKMVEYVIGASFRFQDCDGYVSHCENWK